MSMSQFFKPVLIGTLMFAGSQAVMADAEHHQAKGKGAFSFALIGDTPYKVAPGQDYPPFDNLVKAINEDEKVKWVMHAGDIKSGSTFCSDALFEDRLQRYNQFDKPFILTPGDNGWTDCHRVKAGEYQPLERLAKFREIFYSQPGYTLGGERMEVETQATVSGFEEFPENMRWTEQGVVFASLHVVGSQNGLRAFDPASSAVRTDADDDEVARRNRAVLAWMDETFAVAMKEGAPGVLLMMQANPGLERKPGNHDGFEEILTALEAHVKAYGKPVVLAHGDSHYFREDKPTLISGEYLPNFTRVETFGSSKVHWIKVMVDPRSENVFNVEQKIIEANR